MPERVLGNARVCIGFAVGSRRLLALYRKFRVPSPPQNMGSFIRRFLG